MHLGANCKPQRTGKPADTASAFSPEPTLNHEHLPGKELIHVWCSSFSGRCPKTGPKEQVKREIKREIQKYLEANENGNTTYKTYRM